MNNKTSSKPSSYQILASMVSYHLGDSLSEEKLCQLEEAINTTPELVNQSEMHGVAPLFYVFLKDWELNLDINPYIKIQFKALALRHQHAAQARAKVLIKVIDCFEQNNIEMLLLKGAALASMIYAQPMLRPMRDIDILVPQDQQNNAQSLLEEIGFVFESSHASVFMGGMHHLPNAIRMQDGLTISMEVHQQVYSRDVQDSQYYEQICSNKQKIKISGKTYSYALGHIAMLNHLCRHSFSLGEQVRLIHQYDILKYLQVYADEIDWTKLDAESPFIVNTIRCLHYSVFIPQSIADKISLPKGLAPNGVGDAMLPYSQILSQNKSLYTRLCALFAPSAWWMHVNYNIAPEKSLKWCYISSHFTKVLKDISMRLYFAVMHRVN